jgi:DNA-directed RNA polymerase specialized sigma24 family protein
LDRLEPPLRTALVLRYFLEMDSGQIGAILEEPASTVRSRLRAARQRLASELKRAGYRHEP